MTVFHVDFSAVRPVLACAGALLVAVSAADAQVSRSPSASRFESVLELIDYSKELDLTDVFFVSPEIGYVSGAAGTILKTTDGGASWTVQRGGDPMSEERAVTRLWFVTPTSGWATQVTSSHTNLLRTRDGRTWETIAAIAENYDDFEFTSEAEGIYVDDQHIRRTRDGGKTWTEVHQCAVAAPSGRSGQPFGCNLVNVHYASASVVYALGAATDGVYAAVVLKSKDGGSTWAVAATLQDENATEGGLSFVDENTGFLSSKDSGSAYRTVDGGVTWTAMPERIHRRILFADSEVGFTQRYNDLSFTTDGGRSWSSLTLDLPTVPNAFGLAGRDAYAVGDRGTMSRYRIVPASATRDTTAPSAADPAPALPGRGITVTSLALEPTSVAGGNPVIGTITLSAPAPAEGFRVRLTSSDPQRAQAASEVQIAGGQQTGQFSIQTFPTNQHPDVVDPDPATTISASSALLGRGAAGASARLTVTPAALTGFTVTSPIPSGMAATATVTLNGPAPPSGITLALTNDGATELSMPSSIAIPPGERTANFTITPDPEIFNRAFVIQARRSTFDTDQAPLFVRIPAPELLFCPGRPFAAPEPLVGRPLEFTGGNDVGCIVRLDGFAPYDDYGVTLTSSDPAYATVEKTVYVDKGERDADILVLTKPVTEPRTVTVAGMAVGVTKSESFRLIPVDLKRVIVEPDPVMGGQIVNVTVELTGPAPAPLSVIVDSSHSSIFEVLTPIPIAANENSGSRAVATQEIDEDRAVVATARFGTQSVQRQFVVERTKRPDLTVSFAQVSRQYVVINVINVGDADAPASTLKIETFKGQELLSSDLAPVGAIGHETSALPPNNYRQVLINNLAGQGGRWKAYADAPDEIEEGQEGNNIAEYSLY